MGGLYRSFGKLSRKYRFGFWN